MKKARAILFFLLSGFLCLAPAARAYDFLEEKSTHFIVYYDKGVSKDFVRTVIDYSERYYDELTQRLGLVRFDYWTWDERAKIYLYPDQETYMKESGQPNWSGGVAAYEQKSIWTFPREAGFFDSLLPHEIGHIILRDAIGSRRVPLWFEEGIASYLEQAKRYGAEKTVLNAMRDQTFVPLKNLSAIDTSSLQAPGAANLFYAESVSVVNYLIEKFGVERFSYLLRKIKEGMDFNDALAYAFFDVRSVDDLGKSWEESLRKKLKGAPQAIL